MLLIQPFSIESDFKFANVSADYGDISMPIYMPVSLSLLWCVWVFFFIINVSHVLDWGLNWALWFYE